MHSKWRRGLTPILGAILVASVGMATGAAASLALGARTLGAGSASIVHCTTSAISVVQTVPSASVTAIVASGFPSACGGATVRAAVNNGTASSTGSATVPVGGGTVTVTLGTAVVVAVADQVDLLVSGP